jgi:hypothetical protein
MRCPVGNFLGLPGGWAPQHGSPGHELDGRLLFLACVCLLAIDIVTGFGFVLPRLAPSLRGLAYCLSPLLKTSSRTFMSVIWF